jgi:cytochrome c oxidase assembly factor CtaG
MMTNIDIVTELWNWRSPALPVTILAAGFYSVLAWRRSASPINIGFFAACAAGFLIALASPVATLASRYLFSAHMAQHLLLLLIVPLCGILAWPPSKQVGNSVRPPRPFRGSVPIGWAAGVGAMWFWHIPALCTASMRSPLVLDIQIVSLIAAGAAFWRPVFSPSTESRMPPHLAAMYLFAGCVGCSLLGIYITFSPISVCPLYANPTGSSDLIRLIRDQWGFSHRVDQEVGGLLMWVPACMVYLGAILTKLSSWYHVSGPSESAANSLAAE